MIDLWKDMHFHILVMRQTTPRTILILACIHHDVLSSEDKQDRHIDLGEIVSWIVADEEAIPRRSGCHRIHIDAVADVLIGGVTPPLIVHRI